MIQCEDQKSGKMINLRVPYDTGECQHVRVRLVGESQSGIKEKRNKERMAAGEKNTHARTHARTYTNVMVDPSNSKAAIRIRRGHIQKEDHLPVSSRVHVQVHLGYSQQQQQHSHRTTAQSSSVAFRPPVWPLLICYRCRCRA